MRELLRGWKRKLGCVTLGLACVFFAAWGQGQVSPNRFTAPLGSLTDCELELTRHRIIAAVHWIILPTADQQVNLDDDGIVMIEDKPIDATSAKNRNGVSGRRTNRKFPNG